MPTRRELLAGFGVAPWSIAVRGGGVEILEEPHCLSRESARGYRLLLKNERSVPAGGDLIIVAGARRISIETCRALRVRVEAGAWVMFESGVCFSSVEEAAGQAAILERAFDLNVLPRIVTKGCSYVAYTWPHSAMTRTFERVTPIQCVLDERVADFGGAPVCARKRLGNGGVVYLGTMLGPSLFAEEREAHAIGRALLRQLRG